MRKALAKTALTLSLSLLSFGAWADAGLYDDPIPPNSAYLRVIDATGSADAQVTVGGQELSVPSAKMSPYIILPAGEQTVEFAGISAKVPLKASTFVTMALGLGSQAQVFSDPPVKNPAKAGIYFYNLSDAPVSLNAEIKGKSAPIFADVAPGESKFREVAALEVALSVVKNGQAEPLSAPVSLKRQNGVSVIYFGSGTPSVATVDNSVQR